MKSIKNVSKIFALAILVSFSFYGKAQNNEMKENRKEIAEQRFKELSDRLQLTPEQQTKVKAIAKENRMEMKQLRETKKDAPKEERRAAMMAQLKKVNEQINVILTPKQQELYSQYKAEKKAEREKRMKEKHMENGEIEDGRLF